jgi:hypothetical protein
MWVYSLPQRQGWFSIAHLDRNVNEYGYAYLNQPDIGRGAKKQWERMNE